MAHHDRSCPIYYILPEDIERYADSKDETTRKAIANIKRLQKKEEQDEKDLHISPQPNGNTNRSD